jgi:hypothetical protein
METKDQIGDSLKLIKETFTEEAVSQNLKSAIEKIKTICTQREYVVEGDLNLIFENVYFNPSTLSSRKKLARKIYYFEKKQNLRTIRTLLSFIRRRFTGDEFKVSVKPSALEQQIDVLRSKYKTLRSETEEARLKLKEAKILFNQKKSAYDNR